MKISAFIIIAILNLNILYSQNSSYPSIKDEAAATQDFVPEGWNVIKSAKGDLNGDKIKDVAFIIQYRDSLPMLETYGDNNEYTDTIFCQQRILVIGFYDKKLKSFKKFEQSNTFILCHCNPNMDDPFEDISIQKQVLKIDFRIWYSIGSWTMSTHNYKFRYQGNEFTLIGADYKSVHRASGKFADRSYNFLNKKVKIRSGHISKNKEKIEWRDIDILPLKTLKTFTAPFTWKISDDFTI